jgi:tetratricopeptide (TPR) repeat protein
VCLSSWIQREIIVVTMDRAALQSNAAGEQTRGSVAGVSSTCGLRRSPTASAVHPTASRCTGDNPVPPSMSSPYSLSVMGPDWNEQGEVEDPGGGSGKIPDGHRRDSFEGTMPTLGDVPDLIDEEEEQEMISYERETLMRGARGIFSADDNHLRRTPGASMYRSQFQDGMRRTPGAHQMHKSAENPATTSHPSGAADTSGLGFGLTLSTPMAATRGKPVDLASTWNSTPSKVEASEDQTTRPPLPRTGPSRDHRGPFISPLSLNKFGSRRGAYSPNTLRLTEDLGNLLLEDGESDDSVTSGMFEFGNDKASMGREPTFHAKQLGSESWTAPYIMNTDAPSRTSKSSTRGRRAKTELSRRPRAHDRCALGSRSFEESTSVGVGGFLQYAQQPKAVRSGPPEGHGAEQGAQFSRGFQAPTELAASHAGHVAIDGSPGPNFLNFGGAFAPPARRQTSNQGFQPVASIAASQELNPGAFFQSQSGGQPAFAAGSGHFVASPFHNSFQQPGLPHFGDQQPDNFDPQFVSQPFMFGSTHAPVNPSPNFNMPPQCVVYPMPGVSMHPPSPHDFMPVMLHHQRQYEQVQAQNWGAPPMDMRYDGTRPQMDHRASWRHGGPGGWPMGGYAMPPTSDSPALSMSRATPTWTPEPDLVNVDTHFFSAQQGQVGLAPSPGPPGKGSKKNQRKCFKKPTKPQQTKSDRSTPSSQVVPGMKSPMQKKGKSKPPKANPHDSNPTLTEEMGNTMPDELGDSHRVDADESPETKAALKELSKRLRVEERSSFQDAQSYAFKALAEGTLPESTHWKVYLELADIAKRANRFSEARNLYQKVCYLQPHAIQGWLEFSKLEEECGNMKLCAAILRAGIEHCEYNDGLYARAIKHEEKIGEISRARELLSRLKNLGIENVWRTVLEGALLEARTGNHVMARRVLKYLMHHVPWYGPLYLEAYKLEKNLGRSREALQVVERGLLAIPRYGPLWFGAFKLCEEHDQSSQKFTLPQTMSMIDRSTFCVSKEIIWKVHLEAAQMLERCAVEFLNSTTDPTAQVVLDMSRKRFARTILTCPPNLRWKVWLASGRMEVAAGNTDRARTLFLRAHEVVPDKGRAVALLECARLEEYVGDIELAKAILCKSRIVSGSDWKVWLESVLFEIRCGNKVRAIELASTALKQHSGTGRLWASLIQLYHYEEGEAKQFETLRHALNAVPKSGEVWCEAARVHLNPFSRTFDIPMARRHLSFATKFTPQYGDGFLETLRLEIIEQWLGPTAKLVWEMTRRQCDLSEQANKKESLIAFVGKIARTLFIVCQDDSLESSGDLAITTGLASMIRSRLKDGFFKSTVDLSELCQRCANADPNYGLLWFHCREAPSGTARQILTRATELMQDEIGAYAHIYMSALVRRLAILSQVDRDSDPKAKSTASEHAQGTNQNPGTCEDLLIEAYLSAPSLQEILSADSEKGDTKTAMVLLESTMTGSRFVSGLVALCNQASLSDMASSSEKRKVLFGTDALFS